MRGANGGYSPQRSLKEVSIKDIIEAIEGPVALTKCVETSEQKNCNLYCTCITKNVWNKVNNSVQATLHKIKINDITDQSRSFID